MNFGTFAGNLGRSADFKVLDSGQKVLNFSVAVRVGWGDREETLWVECALWGDRGEKLQQYLNKGTKVAVAGDVNLRLFDKKDGSAGGSITVNVQRITLMGGGEQKAEHQEPQKVAEQKPAPKQEDFDDQDIPF